jgi:hypothetical protein
MPNLKRLPEGARDVGAPLIPDGVLVDLHGPDLLARIENF